MSYSSEYSDSDDEKFPPVATSKAPRRIYNFGEKAVAKLTFPCVQCDKVFESKKALVRHKECATDHEYCALHDEDFEDWEDYAVHRVNSREHRTCEHCYRDFGSKDGLDLHKAQFHRGIQTTMCPYCNKVFRGGMAGLSMHFESNQCKGGMTRVELNSIVNALKTGQPVSHKQLTETASVHDEGETLRNMGVGTIGSEENDLGIKKEDVKRYFNNLFGKYVCPCGKKFGQMQSMWQHLQSISHQKKSYLCVGCQKHFKGASALLQHQQSGSMTCYLASNEAARAADLATGGLVATIKGDHGFKRLEGPH
ncbi:hypothetical protein FN846DRAFT_893569 [Sphaerosporella brunnea]|uniref:C2H2-type domain-containing protein n=1 Tax=Sphaerosporella brunnea TaxID=1250544 RepID=A0A5J5ELI5_9PEZI|nr:hypothetical protein FN846DRAFT_893569 [Sphaerosporella brunnea]